MSVRVLCPKCSTKCVIGEDKIGKGFTCPCCGNRMRVPKSEDMEAVDFLRNRLPELPTLPSATNGSGHTVTAFEIKQNRIETLFPPSAPRKRQTVSWQKIALATPILLGVFIAVGVYFRSVPEDWEAVKKAVTPEEKPAKQLTKANAPGLKEEKVVNTVTVATLVNDFKNELAGQAKYGGEMISVTGRVRWNAGGVEPMFNLYDLKEDTYVTCCFSYSENSTGTYLSQLDGMPRTDGVIVTVDGWCDGPGKLKQCYISTPASKINDQVKQQRSAQETAERKADEKLEQGMRDSDDVAPISVKSSDATIEVIGTLRTVRQLPQNEYGVGRNLIEVTVLPLGYKNNVDQVYCLFRVAHKTEILKLTVGSQVRIRGKRYSGMRYHAGATNLFYCVLMD